MGSGATVMCPGREQIVAWGDGTMAGHFDPDDLPSSQTSTHASNVIIVSPVGSQPVTPDATGTFSVVTGLPGSFSPPPLPRPGHSFVLEIELPTTPADSQEEPETSRPQPDEPQSEPPNATELNHYLRDMFPYSSEEENSNDGSTYTQALARIQQAGTTAHTSWPTSWTTSRSRSRSSTRNPRLARSEGNH